MSTADFGDVSR
ncbi:hypothetical protein SLEP1_g57457, partial [Rubroshorea leprosula]